MTKIRVGFLLSGAGRTLDNLCDKIAAQNLPIEICLVISSHAQAKGIKIAQQRGLPSKIIDWQKILEPEFSQNITKALREANVQLVLMGGFIRYWKIPQQYAGKVLNIHPALLPKYGGKGMYGMKVHQAVFAAGEKESGCTVHFVDHQYDHGPTVLQRKVSLTATDTPEIIAEKVFAQECLAYPQAIMKVLASLKP